MSKLYILVGVPASGKSTISKHLISESCTVYSTDAIRCELFGDEKLTYTDEWLKKNGYNGSDDHLEKYDYANITIYRMFFERINKSLNEGLDVIADATNISKYSRSRLIKACGENASEIHAIVIATPLDTCIRQNIARGEKLTEKALRWIADDYEEPTPDEGFDSIRFIGDKNSIDYGIKYNKQNNK